MTSSSSIATAHRASSSPSTSSNPALQEPLNTAKEAFEKGELSTAVRSLSNSFKGDLRAFHNGILTLLDSPAANKEALIEEVLSQHPHFDLNMYNKEAKTALDLAVQHDDQKFARYLLDKGAKPERTSLNSTSDGMGALITSWQRKNLLYAYFNERNRQSWTPLDRLLHEGRREEVRTRLQNVIAEHGVRKIWEEAMDAGQHDILRALLVVSTPDELRELTKQKEQVGKWREALKGDRGLSLVLKQFSKPSSSSVSQKLRSGFAFLSKDLAVRNKHYVKNAYKALRFYHGTNKVGLESIQANGMSTRLKAGGTMETGNNTAKLASGYAERSRAHNYFIKWKGMTNVYATYASASNVRDWSRREGAAGVLKAARLFKTSDFPEFEHDSDGPSFLPSYRTRSDIPRHAIRQEKGPNRYGEEILTALQEYIQDKFKASLSLEEIEKALIDDGVESDSDDDFGPPKK